MQFGDKWLGKMGGGISVSLIGGFSAYQADLWHMTGGEVPIRVLVTGKQLGITANAEAGHAFVLLTGVEHPGAFDKLESRGVDWALNVGGSVDDVAKSTNKLGQALWSAAKEVGNWAANSSAKKAVQTAMGDFDISQKNPRFMLIPTPLSVGVGAGIFYEWQTLVKIGSDIAWEYIKPKWHLRKEGNSVMLYMDSIPEKDGTRIGIHLTKSVFGSDSVIKFGNPSSPVLIGTVKDGRLHDANGRTLGINLKEKNITEVTEINFLSTPDKKTNLANQTIEIGINVGHGLSETNLYKWRSDDYASVKIDGEGRISSA